MLLKQIKATEHDVKPLERWTWILLGGEKAKSVGKNLTKKPHKKQKIHWIPQKKSVINLCRVVLQFYTENQKSNK